MSGEDGIGGGIGDIKTRIYDGAEITDIIKRCVMIANGGLIVADLTERRLKVFNGTGIFVRSFVCRKNNYDAPLRPDMIALDSQNRIIVADKRRGVIYILDMSGKFIREFGVKKDGKPSHIEDIHVTSQDNIIVVTKGYPDHNLTVFDSSGVCLGQTTFDGKWFFSNGRMLADGNLYDFTKENTKKLQTIEHEDVGERIAGTAYGFIADDKGNMHVRYGGHIQVCDASGKKIEDIEGGYGGYEVGGYGGYEEGGMSMLANNHIAVSHGTNTSIWDGKSFHDFTGSLLTVTKGSAIVCDIVETHNESLFVFNKITAPDTVQTLFKIPHRGIVSIATDAANRTIVGDHGCVRILNPDGSIKRIITDADGRGGMFGTITAVATDQKNRIVVADRCGDGHWNQIKHVRIFDANGVFLESNTDDKFREKGFKYTADVLESYPKMARDSHDRIISSSGTSIEIQDSSGNDVKKISVSGAHDERIEFVDALTVDRWDRIIAVDRHRLTIRFFDHQGEPIRTVLGIAIGGKNLESIHGIAADGMGRIIISGIDENDVALIQVFGPVHKPKKKTRGQQTVERHRDPLYILKTRYAKGEITDEQFETMKKKIA